MTQDILFTLLIAKVNIITFNFAEKIVFIWILINW